MTASKKPGRPSKLTAEVKERLFAAVRTGSHYEQACIEAGITFTTFRNWIKRGEGTHPTESQTPEHIQFFEEAMRAEVTGEISLIATVRKAAASDWRAAAWILERRHSDRWANTQRLEIAATKKISETVTRLKKMMPDESYRDMLVAMAALGYESEEDHVSEEI